MRVISSDSFRFWESLACGTVPLQVDFEHYGLQLPVQPKPFEHYIPARFDDLGTSVRNLKQRFCDLEQIARQGRTWALENYSPSAATRRLLEFLP